REAMMGRYRPIIASRFSLTNTERSSLQCLALRVLWSLTGALQTGLLTFLHTWVTCEVTSFTQGEFPLGVDAQEGASHGVANSARLTTGTTTHHTHAHIIAIA